MAGGNDGNGWFRPMFGFHPHKPMLRHRATATVLGGMMWFWILVRAREDGPVLLVRTSNYPVCIVLTLCVCDAVRASSHMCAVFVSRFFFFVFRVGVTHGTTPVMMNTTKPVCDLWCCCQRHAVLGDDSMSLLPHTYLITATLTL